MSSMLAIKCFTYFVSFVVTRSFLSFLEPLMFCSLLVKLR